MQLDQRTNNNGLMLALELIDIGSVLLFAAVTQVGNWLSWQSVSSKDRRLLQVTFRLYPRKLIIGSSSMGRRAAGSAMR